MRVIPTGGEVAKEALIVVAGAVLAAVIIGQLPQLRDWIKRQWGATPAPANPWQ